MNRDEAIQWCEKYLPQWPAETLPLHLLARPLGWYWVQSLDLANPKVMLKSGDNPVIFKDNVPKFKTVNRVKVLNRDEAIQWCKLNLKMWPPTTRLFSPEGWRWVSKETPYQDSEILLINEAGLRIYRKMVTGL